MKTIEVFFLIIFTLVFNSILLEIYHNRTTEDIASAIEEITHHETYLNISDFPWKDIYIDDETSLLYYSEELSEPNWLGLPSEGWYLASQMM